MVLLQIKYFEFIFLCANCKNKNKYWVLYLYIYLAVSHFTILFINGKNKKLHRITSVFLCVTTCQKELNPINNHMSLEAVTSLVKPQMTLQHYRRLS